MIPEIYRHIASGLVARLIKRGRLPSDAEGDASYLLGLAMLANLITLAILLGYWISPGFSSVATLLLLFFVLEKLNLAWIRGSIKQDGEILMSRAISSYAVPLYIFGSLAIFVLIAFTVQAS